MQNIIILSVERLRRRGIFRGLSSLGIFALVTVSTTCRADVSAVGDTNPAAATINSTFDAGGSLGGDLIVGDTGVGGLFMDAAPPLFGTLAPLEMENGIIGNLEGSIGAVTLDDFGGGDFVVNVDFTVGNDGQAFLDLFDSASVTVTGRTTFGTLEQGAGVATVNGQGSRIITNELFVGDLGYGQLDLTQRAILVSGTAGGASVIGNDAGGIGIIGLTDIGSRWTVGSLSTPATLTIGNLLGTGQGTLKVSAQALVQTSDDVVINSLGRVELATGGRLRMLPTATTAGAIITNRGVLLGDGFVDAAMTITSIGEVRNAAGLASLREKLIFSGPVTNNGTIESLGGEMEFLAPVINNLEIVARDAVLRFPQGLTNNGDLVLGGNTTIHGSITPAPLSNITVLPGSDVVVIGDLVFSAASIVSLVIGDDAGTLSVTGMADLTGAPILSLDYASGGSPQPGDIYQVFQASDGITGAFANATAFAGGATWNILQMGNSIFATFNTLSVGPMGADFNGDGTVDGTDLAIWQANFGQMGALGSLDGLGDADSDGDVDGRDFLRIQQEFGGPGVEPIVGAVVSVPEPSALVLLLSAAVGCIARRKR